MRPLVWIGIVFVIGGLLALAYQGITYFDREAVIDVGPVHISAERERTIPLPPIVGGSALIVGLILIWIGAGGPARPPA